MKLIRTSKHLLFVFATIGVLSISKAQTIGLAAEKVHDISGKEKRGYLGNVVVDDSRQQIDLVFVTKATNKTIKFTAHQFDYDLNHLNTFSEEMENEKVSGSKYGGWFKYKGDNFSVVGVSAEANMTGKLVVKKKETSYNWSWWSGRYKKKTKTLDKVKFKAPSGRKITYRGHFDIDEKGEVIILAGQPDKYFMEKSYSLMRIGPDLNVISEETIDMGYVQNVTYSGPIIRDNMDDSETPDWAVIMTAAGGKGVTKKKENCNPDMQAATYFRITPEGKVKEKIEFKTRSLDWNVISCYERDGAVYLYGPGQENGVGEKYQTLMMLPSNKYSNFQLVKFSGGKVDFVAAPNLDEFESKAKKPASQKKQKVYNGRKVDIRGITVTSNGDVFVNAQDFKQATQGETVYTDLYMFHFTNSGSLKASYGIESVAKKGGLTGGGELDARRYPTDGDIFESPDGKSLYWFLFPVKKVFSWTETSGNVQYTYYEPRIIPRIGKIDIASGEPSEFSEVGNGEFYLFQDNKFKTIDGGKSLIFLGEGGEKGKQIWLGKFDPTKL